MHITRIFWGEVRIQIFWREVDLAQLKHIIITENIKWVADCDGYLPLSDEFVAAMNLKDKATLGFTVTHDGILVKQTDYASTGFVTREEFNGTTNSVFLPQFVLDVLGIERYSGRPQRILATVWREQMILTTESMDVNRYDI